jgi:type II secretory pathway component PulM
MTNTRKRWRDLSLRQRRAISVIGAVQALLQVATWWDLWRRPADRVRGRKLAWLGASLVQWVGPLAYWVRGRKPEPRAT